MITKLMDRMYQLEFINHLGSQKTSFMHNFSTASTRPLKICVFKRGNDATTRVFNQANKIQFYDFVINRFSFYCYQTLARMNCPCL